MTKYTANDPFSLRIKGNSVSAWPDHTAKGGIKVKIECQVHDIQTWIDEGQAIISAQQFSSELPLKQKDIIGLIYNDTKKSAEAIVAAVHEKMKTAAAKKLMANVNDVYDLLLKGLVFIRSVLDPQIEAAAKAKADAKKNGKKVTAVKVA